MKLNGIYIPTLGRLNRQITFDNLPDRWKEITHLVVRKHEFREAQQICPNALCLPDWVSNIADTRKWIIEHAGNSQYAMFDDDLLFWRRHCDRKTGKKNAEKSNTACTEQDFDELFGEIVPRWFDEGVVVGGINYKGKPPANKSESDFGRMIDVFFINGAKLPSDLDWSLSTCEDMHFVLQVLRNGCKTRISDDFLYSTKYWSEGGCQLQGRTVEEDLKNVKKLITLHEGFVEMGKPSIVNTGIYKDNPTEHVGLKIHWKKAYESSVNKWNQFVE